jgi:hypothetical protein
MVIFIPPERPEPDMYCQIFKYISRSSLTERVYQLFASPVEPHKAVVYDTISGTIPNRLHHQLTRVIGFSPVDLVK